MADLIAIAYPDVDTAKRVRDKLAELQKQQLITLADAVVVERREDGKVKLHQGMPLVGAGAVGGALWGGLIGMLFLAPLVGMAVGAATGAAGGAMSDTGIDDSFMKDVGESIQPGTAALFVLVVDSTPDRVIPQIQDFGGRVLQTSLSKEQEENLRSVIGAHAHT